MAEVSLEIAQLRLWAALQVCPDCHHQGLTVDVRLTYKPSRGAYSLVGNQEKVVMTPIPWLVCPACGLEAQGKAVSDDDN